MRRKVAIHLAANILILALAYYWLGIPESRALTLAWSLFIALLVLALAAWTYTASFLPHQQWRTARQNMLPMLAAVMVVLLAYGLLAKWSTYSAKPAFQLASWLTLRLRKPVRPSLFMQMIQIKLWLLRWIVLPVFFLPVLAAIASHGWSGFRKTRWRLLDWRYWIETPLLLLCCLRLPLFLVYWVPGLDGFFLQSASVALRFLVAYLLFGIAWLVLAFVTSEGNPRATQPSTAVSP